VTWQPPDLRGRVAVVTGASRGVGRGVALVLGECGATVYVTGRSTRPRQTVPTSSTEPARGPDAVASAAERPATGAARPGGGAVGPYTVEDTADAITERGGRGIAAPTDHTDDAQVEALFARVHSEQLGRLDLVVANAWGGYEGFGPGFTAPFWEQPLARWDAMFTAGLRAHFTSARAAAPTMIASRSGLIVLTGGTDLETHYLGNVPYDVVKAASSRLVAVLAHELRPHGVAAVGVYPGFTRTEAVVAAFAAEGAQPPPETHSPEFVGRAVASLLADPDHIDLSGAGAQAAVLARRYGFADVDGREIAPFALPDEYRLSSDS
jgi:NAD(P)-dependent dehydrogenase (short-subunit alcohol dehydrogenase family)